jgi:hypothetical protein
VGKTCKTPKKIEKQSAQFSLGKLKAVEDMGADDYQDTATMTAALKQPASVKEVKETQKTVQTGLRLMKKQQRKLIEDEL